MLGVTLGGLHADSPSARSRGDVGHSYPLKTNLIYLEMVVRVQADLSSSLAGYHTDCGGNLCA